MSVCPCCGRPIVDEAPLYITSPSQRRIFEALAKAPNGLTREQLENELYWDDPDGGAETASRVVYVQIHKLRRTLESQNAPWRLPLLASLLPQGFKTGGRYRLVSADA